MEKKQDITQGENEDRKGFDRRDVIKSLATLPVLGAFAYGIYQKRKYGSLIHSDVAKEIGISTDEPKAKEAVSPNSKTIRIGLIGYGIRGKQLAKSLGYVHPSVIDDWKAAAVKSSDNTTYHDFLEQEDLNVRIAGVCDIFNTYGRTAQEAGANLKREGTVTASKDQVKRYRTYKELIAASDVDAVVIATPDHWHGPITIEAAKNKKHVYCEKPMTWSVEETYEVRKAVKENGIVYQLGHQGRQTDSYDKAKEAIAKGVLGPVNLIEVTTNRNDLNGAWVYPIQLNANPKTIDWEQFIGQAPWHEFSLERFFRWRCWWDYSTGLSGDLLTHEYDAVNQVLGLGIPKSATSSGGIYFYKDGRTVPDVLTTVFEFPDRDLSLLYSGSLSSQMSRGKRVMGHDAYMDMGSTLLIYADPRSTRYKEKIEQGMIKPDTPIYSYVPGKNDVDGVSSATERYFAKRGLLYTHRDGKRVDTTHLHVKEWLEAIRGNGTTSCNIDRAFEEAMTAHMGTISYRENRKVFWDAENEKIV